MLTYEISGGFGTEVAKAEVVFTNGEHMSLVYTGLDPEGLAVHLNSLDEEHVVQDYCAAHKCRVASTRIL